ncbi:MFS transporter [Waterburya agarophytonicola K14]|uniref:MFS transporter n=1 Tax=Waterburya agarophytonicola KI4 TaxID=2874699 RepID=A0A964BTD8_9CYAN|nr:MFS transporter [Waterburya agarophytonicola]MCC0178491.1 MFS transporter [Waterburya agarophytonicola KI4]
MSRILNFSFKVWILATGRLLLGIGTGFTLFYAPIFFVNQVGLSSTLVGVALGSGSISGVFGRFLGGQLSDTPSWGRRKTLLVASAISVLADVVLSLTSNFPTLILGNLLMGFGSGMYWPATEAAIIDLTVPEQRNEAFAITRLADSLGLSLGVVLGGALIASSGNYRALFIIDGISFIIFFGVIYFAIAETFQFQIQKSTSNQENGWSLALRDRALMVFVAVNILFTIYLSQVQSTMPLYLKNFVQLGDTGTGFSERVISGLFTWHIAFAAVCQLPAAWLLNRFNRITGLSFSLVLWGIAFILVWVTGNASDNLLFWAALTLGVMSWGMITYTPIASGLVADLAPESLRGVYLSINSQCWAIGYFVGPPLGGWALDHPESINYFWLFFAASVLIGIVILQYLHQLIDTK